MNDNIPQSFKDIVRGEKFVVLDTETTGLHNPQIVEIAVIDPQGSQLVNTRLKPTIDIEPGASRVHGITNDMLVDAPTYAQVFTDIWEALHGKTLLIYNAQFDVSALNATHRAFYHDPVFTWWDEVSCIDVMSLMAPIVGDWNDYHQNYKWPKLSESCWHYGIDHSNAHGALADATATLAVIRAMVADQ